MIRYSEEQKQFIIKNNYMRPAKELAEMFNKKFNTNIEAKHIKNFRRNNKLSSGLTGRFEKGHIPINKGTKGMFNVGGNKTSFKKGNTPANSDPVGTEKWKCSHNNCADEGFLYVKIQDKKGRFNWKQKHRLIWEEAYGPIPKGHKVIFLDGNRHHIELSNLILVSNSQMLIMNKNNLIYKDKELTKTGHLIAKVIEKSRKIKND